MTEAILLFSPWSSPAHSTARSTKVQWHWLLQASALLCAYTGLAVITANKVLGSTPHYTTWHGTMGILLCAVLAIQASGGIVTMWPEILPFKVRLVTLKRLHAVSGMCSYLGGLATLTLGLYSAWFVANVGSWAWLSCLSCLVVLAGAVGLQITRNSLLPLWK